MTEIAISVALHDIMRFALPASSEYFVGADVPARQVRWAVIVGVPLRRDELMEIGDIVIVAERSDEPDWESAIGQFAEIEVAAVVVNRPVPSDALEIAAAAELPIVRVPSDSDLRAIHRGVLTLILRQEAQVAQRSAEIVRELQRLAAEDDASLTALAEVIATETGHGVLVQDKRLKTVAVQPPDGMPSKLWNRIVGHLGESRSLPDGWRDRRATARNARGQVESQSLEEGVGRIVAPIVVGELARGYLSVIALEDDLDALDAIAVEQGAEIYALAMSKAKAVSETTKRLRGEFVDAVLAGSISPLELERWAGRLGHNVYAPHSVVVFGWGEGPDSPSVRRIETMVNGEIGLGRHSALVRNTGDQVECFVVLDDPESAQNALNLAQGVRDQAESEYPDTPLLSGIGRVAQRLDDWVVSHREATQAFATAGRIKETKPLYFGDLSVYRLLFQIEDHPELEQFCTEMLGKLLEYDAQHNSTLVETLSEYFSRRGNLSQTAEALFIHRNTLQYRMERIADITGLDLDNPDTRLAVQLALKAYRLFPAFDRLSSGAS